MKPKTPIVIIALAVLGLGVFLASKLPRPAAVTTTNFGARPDLGNLTFHIGNMDVPLSHGEYSYLDTDGKKVDIKLLFVRAAGDISHDGINDYVVVLEQDMASRKNFYLSAAIASDQTLSTIPALLLPDVTVPHSLVIEYPGVITFQYFKNPLNERDFKALVTKTFILEDSTLKER
jgi:hypothetical protein